MAKSLTEAGDLSFLADLLLLAGIEGVRGTRYIQHRIGTAVANFPFLGATGQVVRQSLGVFGMNVEGNETSAITRSVIL